MRKTQALAKSSDISQTFYLKPFLRERTTPGDKRLRWAIAVALLVFCFFQGLVFAFFAPYLLPMFAVVPAFFMGLVIWALPDTDKPPDPADGLQLCSVTDLFLSLAELSRDCSSGYALDNADSTD